MKLRATIFLAFFFIIQFGWGQQFKFYEIKNKADYPFILYLPDSNIAAKNPPIIIFLHGRSLSGNDLELVKKYGVIDAIERGRKIPAIVIAPQVKKTEFWQPDKVLSVLEYVQKNYQSDLLRVYVVGMSLGGYGTLNFIGKYPDKVAAAIALCGGGNLKDACNIGNTNVWIQHGQLDKAVPCSESVQIYNAISSCNPKGICKLTLYPNFGHGELAREFYKDTLYNWIFQFRSNFSNIEINPSIDTLKKPLIVSSVLQKDEPILIKDEKLKTKSENCFYSVKKGDTLYKIAKKYHTSVVRICKDNKIKKSSILNLGDIIIIK